MGFQLKHVQETANGQRYRRRIPKDVKESLNSTEKWFLRPLGSFQEEVLRNYSNAHAEFERLVGSARTKARASAIDQPIQRSELDLHKELEQSIRELGYDPHKSSFDPHDPDDNAEFNSRSYHADLISGDTVGYSSDEAFEDIPKQDLALVRALLSGVPQTPPPTLRDGRVTV